MTHMNPEEWTMTFEHQQEIVARARSARAEAVAALIAAAAGGLWGRVQRLHRAWSGAHARAALYALSDRTLKDIGLHRSQIESLYR
jgi:uncharacterized protein YjiS (DUF1127 family)